MPRVHVTDRVDARLTSNEKLEMKNMPTAIWVNMCRLLIRRFLWILPFEVNRAARYEIVVMLSELRPTFGLLEAVSRVIEARIR